MENLSNRYKGYMYLSIILSIYTIINAFVGMNDIRIKGDDLVVDVNGESINEKQVYDSYKVYRGGIVDFVVQETLLEQGAKGLGVQVSVEDVDKECNNYKNQFENEKEFEEYLKSVNLSSDSINKNIYRDILVSRIKDKLKEDIKLDEKEIKEEFETNKEQYINMDVSYVVINNKDKYDEIFEYVSNNGIDNVKETYGDIIDVVNSMNGVGVYDETFGEYVINAKKDDIYKRSTEDESSILLIYVSEKRDTFEDLKENISQGIESVKVEEKFNEFLNELQTEAKIEYK